MLCEWTLVRGAIFNLRGSPRVNNWPSSVPSLHQWLSKLPEKLPLSYVRRRHLHHYTRWKFTWASNNKGELSALNLWLKVNKLSLNVAKTEFMIVGSRQKLDAVGDNHCINLNIEGKIIKRVDHAKSLGLYIDKNLSWSKHIEEISKKISSGIGALKRIRPFISQNIAVQIYKALIEPHFECCSPVWHGINNKLSDKLQKLQNRAARAITQSNFDTSSSYLRNLPGWDDLSTRRDKQLSIAMFKTLNGFFPKI